MPKYTLKEITEITGKIKFYKLFIDDECLFDEFWETILKAGNLVTELKTINSRMELISNNRSMPKEKFKDITPSKEEVTEYEIKTTNLRVYLIHQKNTGRIVILGGKKGDQKSDIKQFRNIKKEYLKQIK